MKIARGVDALPRGRHTETTGRDMNIHCSQYQELIRQTSISRRTRGEILLYQYIQSLDGRKNGFISLVFFKSMHYLLFFADTTGQKMLKGIGNGREVMI